MSIVNKEKNKIILICARRPIMFWSDCNFAPGDFCGAGEIFVGLK